MKRLLVFLFSIALFLAFSSSAALAFPVTSLFYGDGSTNVAEDDDVEWLQQDNNSDGLLDVGDTLRGVFRVQDFNNYNVAAGGETSTGLSGVFEAQVYTKEETGETDQKTGSELFNYIFGPATYGTGLFENEGQSIIALYETDPLNNFDDEVGPVRTRAELISDVTDGTRLYEFGFTNSENTEYWFANNVTENTSDGNSYSSSSSLAFFNTALNVTWNNFLPVLSTQQPDFAGGFGGNGFSDLIGSGAIYGVSDMITSAEVSSDLNFQFATVPEPTTLLLFGTGLLGLAAFGRKKFMGKKQ